MIRILAVLALACQPALLLADANPPVVAATECFELRSDARVNLHHFLIAWAAADDDAWPPFALPVVERDYWLALLDEQEQRTWEAALQAYASANGRSVVFDAGLIAVRDWAGGAAPRDSIPAVDRTFADALEAALPVYRRHWWPAHDAHNRAWTESLATLLTTVESEVAPRIAAAYGGRWPEAPIAVDVVIYANSVGAYSTGGRITVSGADFGNRMPQALEMLFHEASHVEPLEAPLRAAIESAFDAAGGAAPERFWHDTIFFTAGTITGIALANQGQAGYRHYGEFGVYRRGERWTAQLPLLDAHWRPFLESGSSTTADREAALQAIAEQLRMTPGN